MATNLTWDTLIRPTAGDSVFGNAAAVYDVGVFLGSVNRVLLALPLQGPFTSVHIQFELGAATSGNFNLVALPVVSQLTAMLDFSDISYNHVIQSASVPWQNPGVLTSGPGTIPGNNADNAHRVVFPISAGWTASESVAFADVGSGVIADHVVNPTTGLMADVLGRAHEAAVAQGSVYMVVMLVHEDESLGLNKIRLRGLNGTGAKPSFGQVLAATYVRPSDLRMSGRLGRSSRNARGR